MVGLRAFLERQSAHLRCGTATDESRHRKLASGGFVLESGSSCQSTDRLAVAPPARRLSYQNTSRKIRKHLVYSGCESPNSLAVVGLSNANRPDSGSTPPGNRSFRFWLQVRSSPQGSARATWLEFEKRWICEPLMQRVMNADGDEATGTGPVIDFHGNGSPSVNLLASKAGRLGTQLDVVVRHRDSPYGSEPWVRNTDSTPETGSRLPWPVTTTPPQDTDLDGGKWAVWVVFTRGHQESLGLFLARCC